MTLELADGRGELFQWDTGRIVEFGEDAVSQAHFTNTEKVIDIPYTVEVKNRKATIPDELLQVPGKLIVYAWVSDTNGSYTKVQVNFPVFARPKPSDYVYTPTEHAGFDRLRAEIGDLADLQTDAKDTLVDAINEAAASDGADWNQNDPTAKDYVKNRTHWTGTGAEVIVPEQEITATKTDAPNGVALAIPKDADGDLLLKYATMQVETISVTFDTVEHQYKTKNTNGIPAVGNLSLINAGEDTGEPFTILAQKGPDESISLGIICTVAGAHTIAATATGVVHKLDQKYVPASIIDRDTRKGLFGISVLNKTNANQWIEGNIDLIPVFTDGTMLMQQRSPEHSAFFNLTIRRKSQTIIAEWWETGEVIGISDKARKYLNLARIDPHYHVTCNLLDGTTEGNETLHTCGVLFHTGSFTNVLYGVGTYHDETYLVHVRLDLSKSPPEIAWKGYR